MQILRTVSMSLAEAGTSSNIGKTQISVFGLCFIYKAGAADTMVAGAIGYRLYRLTSQTSKLAPRDGQPLAALRGAVAYIIPGTS